MELSSLYSPGGKTVLSFFSVCCTCGCVKRCLQAGIIEEMMDDVFESMEDQDELEEEADAEVEKVLWELTAGLYSEVNTFFRTSP